MPQTWKIQPHVRSMLDPDGGVLLDLNKGKYYSLNPVGSHVWKKLEDGLSPTEILADLERLFHLSRERLQADLDIFAQGLEQRGLLHVLP